MKKLINFLTLGLSVSISMFILCSFSACEPDPGPPPIDPTLIRNISSGDSSKTIRYFEEDLIDFESILNDELDAESGLTLGEALESIDPDVHPDWKVGIRSYRCPRNGQTLVVFNPDNQDLSFYDAREFSVHWFKDGQPVRGNRIQLECVCKGRYAAVVVYRPTNQGIGIAFHSGHACFADDTVKLQNANN